jgi:hypothetical protein
MANDTNPEYVPSARFDNVMSLFGNHYRFVLDALPDLTFFVQQVTLPSITATTAVRHNPFVKIHEVADHLDFATLTIKYLVDNSFKTYFSLFYWLKGYGFPNSYEEIAEFAAMRRKQLANPRPITREIQKTHGVLTILQPDNDTPVAELAFLDIFPTQLGDVSFDTVGSEPSLLTCHATFAFTDFDVRLTNT